MTPTEGVKLFVWYAPEIDEIRVTTRESGYLFKDKGGVFHLCYFLDMNRPFKTFKAYLIGAL